MQEKPISTEELREFLVKAKKEGYASGKEAVKIPSGEKMLEFKNGLWRYSDVYKGGDKFFSGDEKVFHKESLVWKMDYDGGVESLTGRNKAKEIYMFLKGVLKDVKEEIPFRGPFMFRGGDFLYLNSIHGDIERFNGYETIQFNSKMNEEGSKAEFLKGAVQVYRLGYRGGLFKSAE